MQCVVECWENERWSPRTGWSAWRLATDRPLWSDKKGSRPLHREGFLLPMGWAWTSSWQPEPFGGNPEGWHYAVDFSVGTKKCSSKPTTFSMVRRRRWLRSRTLIGDATTASMTSERDLRADQSSAKNFTPPTPPATLEMPPCREMYAYGFVGAPREVIRAEAARQHAALKEFQPFVVDFFAAMATQKATSGRTGVMTIPDSRLDDVYGLGFPQSLRGTMWLALSGAYERKHCAPGYYAELVEKTAAGRCEPRNEIAIDVERTAPQHPYFENGRGEGAQRLTEVLFALVAHLQTPYQQSFSYIASVVIVNVDNNEDAFWLLVAIIGDGGLVPNGYFSEMRLDIDMEVIREMMPGEIPASLVAHMQAKCLDIIVFTNGWLQAMLTAHLPMPTACRFLDVMFAEGNNTVVLRFTLAFLRIHADRIAGFEDPGSLGQFANSWARTLWNPDTLLRFLNGDGLARSLPVVRARFFDKMAAS